MALRRLYHNEEEPLFPYQEVASKLDWLPEFLANNVSMTYVEYDHPPTFAPLLDTVLVFARARTSALHGICHRVFKGLPLYNCQQWCAIAFRSFWEKTKLYIFQRYKLRELLVRKGVVPQNTIADHVLFH